MEDPKNVLLVGTGWNERWIRFAEDALIAAGYNVTTCNLPPSIELLQAADMIIIASEHDDDLLLVPAIFRKKTVVSLVFYNLDSVLKVLQPVPAGRWQFGSCFSQNYDPSLLLKEVAEQMMKLAKSEDEN